MSNEVSESCVFDANPLDRVPLSQSTTPCSSPDRVTKSHLFQIVVENAPTHGGAHFVR